MEKYYSFENNTYQYLLNRSTGLKVRIGQRDGSYVEDGEISVGGFNLSENVGWINLLTKTSSGTGQKYRWGNRYESFVIDGELTPTGFDGIEDTDWENNKVLNGFWKSRTLKVTAISSILNKLEWESFGGDYDGISIERTDVVGGGSGWAEIDDIASNSTEYEDTVTKDTLYYYRIRGYKGTKYFDYSNVDSAGILPIVIPNTISTIEDSVTHPSVVYFEDGWHGYKYWMAITPYPGNAEEEPCIFVSNDLINWAAPDGGSNPVYTNEDYPYPADTELVYDENLDALVMYFRNNSGDEGLRRGISYDGLTWSVASLINGIDTGSPSVSIKPDGTYVCFGLKNPDSGFKRVVQKSESADGITWGAWQECNYPDPLSIWHHSIKLIDGIYYMLAATSYGTESHSVELYWLTSTDGITWTLGEQYPCIDYHTYSMLFYRSCFLYNGNNRWTVFASQYVTKAWVDKGELGLYKNINLPLIPERPATTLSLVPTLPYIAGDDFIKANNSSSLGVAKSGQSWVNLNENLGILTNRGYRSAALAGSAYIEVSKADNIIIEARFTTEPINGTGWCAIMFRVSDSTHYWLWSILSNGNKPYQSSTLHKRDGGSHVAIYTPGQYLKNTDIIGVKLVGDNIYLMRNNVIIDSYNDSFNNDATKHGIYIYNQQAGFSSFCDLFTIRNI